MTDRITARPLSAFWTAGNASHEALSLFQRKEQSAKTVDRVRKTFANARWVERQKLRTDGRVDGARIYLFLAKAGKLDVNVVRDVKRACDSALQFARHFATNPQQAVKKPPFLLGDYRLYQRNDMYQVILPRQSAAGDKVPTLPVLTAGQILDFGQQLLKLLEVQRELGKIMKDPSTLPHEFQTVQYDLVNYLNDCAHALEQWIYRSIR